MVVCVGGEGRGGWEGGRGEGRREEEGATVVCCVVRCVFFLVVGVLGCWLLVVDYWLLVVDCFF